MGSRDVGTGWEEVAWFVGAGWLGTARVVKYGKDLGRLATLVWRR